jgi:hypothetical protein
MVLRDKKFTAFLSIGVVMAMGLLIVCLLARHGVVPILVGLAFMGAGAVILFRLRRVTIELDKGAGTVHILLEGLKSKEERTLGMAEVQKLLLRKAIQTHTMRSSSNRGFASTSSTTTYHQFILVFVTDQNEEIPFAFGKVKVGVMSMLTSPETKIQRNAQEVANFLGVPLTAAGPASAAQVLGAIRQGFAARFQKVH